MAIFNSYVSLPEGNGNTKGWKTKWIVHVGILVSATLIYLDMAGNPPATSWSFFCECENHLPSGNLT